MNNIDRVLLKSTQLRVSCSSIYTLLLISIIGTNLEKESYTE